MLFDPCQIRSPFIKGETMSTPSLLDAIRVVKENEKIATQNYAEAAKKIDNPLGKHLV